MEIQKFNISHLYERKMPKKKQEFEMKVATQEYELEEGEIVDDEPKIIFKDKRKSYSTNFNRELILKKLKQTIPIENVVGSQAPVIIEEDAVEDAVEDDIPNIMEEKQKEPEEKQKEPEEKQKEPKEKKPKKPRNKKEIHFDEREPVDLTTSKINDVLVYDMLPNKQRIKMRVSPYYMENRKLFIQQLIKMFKPYSDKIEESANELSCKKAKSQSVDFQLLSHQLVVRDYLGLYTPYRGLLLYHGLGAGKTCASIGIAEGMKSGKQIILMTPASLKMNYFSELKKCGDVLYKKQQYWEFVSIEGEPDNEGILAKALGLPKDYIRTHKGAWMVNVTKEANFAQLSDSDQKSVDEQLNAMIRNKYHDINYNGLNTNKMNELTSSGKKNPFDNKVVIIDEAHNLVSRISNSLKNKKSIAYQLYKYLMDAENAKIVFLSGTPIINSPREIAILFNMLRGYIKTWTFQLQVTTSQKVNTELFLDLFKKSDMNTYDFLEYSGDKLTITRNPFGFVNTYSRKSRKTSGGSKTSGSKTSGGRKTSGSKTSGGKGSQKKQKKTQKKTKKNREPVDVVDTISDEEYKEREHEYNRVQQLDLYSGGGVFEEYSGVIYDEMGNISDSEFQKQIAKILTSNGLQIVGKPKITKELALPDDQQIFNEMFIKGGELINDDLLKRRILGLTSYFRSAQEQLLPRFVKDEDGSNYHILNIDMSSHQFNVYKDIRKSERDEEKRNKTKMTKKKKSGDDEDALTSTYRIYSRSACNFAFPLENPRPVIQRLKGLDDFNDVSKELMKQKDDYIEDEVEDKKGKDGEPEEKDEGEMKREYQAQIASAYEFLKYDPTRQRAQEYLRAQDLETYSPKFSAILENILSLDNEGLHLIYSQFRTLEGIGIFKLVLEANGFTQFKITKKSGEWLIEDFDEEKPRYILYTGTETAEEKEILRNIYNSAWEFVPPSIVESLQKKYENNFMGEVIKVIMITSSGAEGINLKNTRFVHIMEPYWNMVRVDQVVGRARRICSHEDLPEALRTVKVYVYLSRATPEQLQENIEMKTQDVSKLTYKVEKSDGQVKMELVPFSTDQYLFEIAQIKDSINRQILTSIKESSIDCSLYNNNPDEPLVCYGYGKVSSNNFGSHPVLETDRAFKPDVKEVKQKLVAITVDGVKYALDKRTKTVYDFESYKRAKEKRGELVAVGVLDERTSQIIFDK